MNSPEPESPLPLAYASELAIELNLLRGECSEAARLILARSSPDADTLEECAQLDEALDLAYRVLQSTLADIRMARSQRARTGGESAI